MIDLYPGLQRNVLPGRALFAGNAVMARCEMGTGAGVEPIDAALPEQEEYGEENSRSEGWV
ncbi:hypothetical protein [Candidatus Reidiella endopervernicosa]|uniref:Uncharacterized protein n=1 Tax=Candidatus Reidiella endopervernicosa TaxID=2738883 RepID=A0A6N0HT60_9GAMM|nr:hypothetical protein [Candidatus Reidiella endopervernicosa]QKQ25595.1 hypothetical protein HUE57_04245 [Candidatus Reidiella endopervernicosa]